MKWLKAAARELFGLFVVDVPFTGAILAWLGIGSLLLPRIVIDASWDAPILFVGCTMILVESVRRSAVKHRRLAVATAERVRPVP